MQDDWDILFAMQQYRTPTRLLDWTEGLGVALYFAG
ncbi:MAG: FRG domain-containing protein [Verrucomicrobia bacterium]|nr:FRG domain-containing protein [Verrucomicrobiota bacterium]